MLSENKKLAIVESCRTHPARLAARVSAFLYRQNSAQCIELINFSKDTPKDWELGYEAALK